jgi:hypothetical protein
MSNPEPRADIRRQRYFNSVAAPHQKRSQGICTPAEGKQRPKMGAPFLGNKQLSESIHEYGLQPFIATHGLELVPH